MTHDQLDHAPIVEAWLKEPLWLPEGDTARIAQLVHQTPQQRGWLRPMLNRRTHDMITVTKFATAGIVLATTGWFLLAGGGLFPQTEEGLPAASPSAVASVAPDTSAEPEASPEADASVAPETTAEAVEGTLVMEAPDSELSAAGWTQAGSAPFSGPDGSGFGTLGWLHAVGDSLVALGSYSPDEDAVLSRDAVFVSADGQTWEPVYLPGTDPVLVDMAATSDGVIVGGLDRVDGERVAKLWTSSDGREWTEVAAPVGATISQIVSAEDPLAVRVNQRLFKQEDDGSWTDVNRLPNSQILRGPSGYITWQGGGQDRRFQLSMIHQAELDGEIREIGLPGKLGRGDLAQIGVQLFVVGDQWVMVPDGVDTPIYVSSDGFEWQAVPRPDRMLGGFVAWMDIIGDEIQAFGIQDRRNGSPSGFWTIDLASEEPAPFEMLDRDANQHLAAPVAFGDGYLAVGNNNGPGNRLTTWQHAAE